MTPAVVLVVALAAQTQAPIVRPIEIRVSTAALECAERQIPPLEAVMARAVRDPAFPANPEGLAQLQAIIARCLADDTSEARAAEMVVGYVSSVALERALLGFLGAGGIERSTLESLEADPDLRSLQLTPLGLQTFEERLHRLFPRLNLAPLRHQIFTYLFARRYGRLTAILLRPPPDRADLVAGTIEPDDYPVRAEVGDNEGDTHAIFEILPDGTVGVCVVLENRGDDLFGWAGCRAIRRRFRYDPARDAQGRPVADVSRVGIRWRLPD